MTTIGGFGQTARSTSAEANRLTPITTPEALRELIPELPHDFDAKLFLGVCEVFGIEPMDHAGMKALFDRFQDLKDKPADLAAELNRRDRNGFTPLHKAVMSRHYEVVIFFLKCGADPTAPVAATTRMLTSRSVGGPNRVTQENLHTGRHALTLAIACDAGHMIVSLLACVEVKGVKLIELQDGRGENAICAAIAREDWLFVYENVSLDPQLGRNSKGRVPLEMAIEHGQRLIFHDILLFSYVPLLQSEKAEDRKLARFDIANVTTLLARSWTGLPNEGRTWLLMFALTGYQYHDVRIIPVEHCVDILFKEGLKLVGTGADSYAQMEQRKTEPHKPGQSDYSLIETLLKLKGHLLLEDKGRGIRAFAEENGNEILGSLCKQAGIKK
jgi:ankyrin repeat protein